MKTIYNHFICILSFISSVTLSFGQEDPMYSQYTFNIQAYNPAYTGTWKSVGIMTLTRHQWVGFDKAPETQTITVQASLRKANVGVGLTVINDKIGYEKRFAVFADYSYRLRLTRLRFARNTYLRLGLKAGFTNYENNLSRYTTYDPEDPLFEGEMYEKIMPNFGLGVFLYSQRYYAGFSIPKILQNDFEEGGGTEYSNTNYEMRYLTLIGGYVFDLNEALEFKPSVIVRYVKSSPVVGDFYANFLLKKKLWIGAMGRTNGEYGFNAQFIVSRNLRIAYAISLDTSEIKSYNYGMHQIMLSYEWNFIKTRYTSPRYF